MESNICMLLLALTCLSGSLEAVLWNKKNCNPNGDDVTVVRGRVTDAICCGEEYNKAHCYGLSKNSCNAKDGHLKGEKDEKIFTLEVRFPEGNKYPQEPAIFTFSTTLTHFPVHACMKVTSRLMQESKAMARDGLPSVFSIVSILENSQELDKIIAGPESKLSLPKVLGSEQVSRSVREDVPQKTGAEAMLSAIEKEGQMELKLKEQERKMLEINRRLRSNFQQKKVSGEVNKMMTVRKSLP